VLLETNLGFFVETVAYCLSFTLCYLQWLHSSCSRSVK